MQTRTKICTAILTTAAASLLTAVLVSCGDDHHQQARFAFTVGDADLAAFTVNPGTGAITQVAGSPYTSVLSAGPCADLAVADPAHKYLFVTDSCNSVISALTIDPKTGGLASVAGSPFVLSVPNNTIEQPAITPSGKFLYAGEDSGFVVGFAIGATGALTEVAGSPFAAGGGDEGIVVDPKGKFLYAADSNNSTISAFSINATTGVLTAVAGAPFALSDVPKFMAIERSGKFMYVSAPENDNVLVLSIDSTTGALTALAGSPVASGGPNPGGIAVSPDGKYLFVANAGDIDVPTLGNVSVFSVNASSGALTAVSGSPFAAAPNPKRIAVDPASKFLYATNEDAGNMTVFAIGRGTGVLTEVTGSPFATNVGSEGVVITGR
jgi:6-phosphogluconolactonase